jgi:hypothetical protein
VLAQAEPDPRQRADCTGLALVFAEAAKRRDVWKATLQEWNMIESQQVLEWMAEGEAKGERQGKVDTLLRQLRKKFPPGAPAELGATVRACQDAEQLDRWLDAIVVAATLDDFRHAM